MFGSLKSKSKVRLGTAILSAAGLWTAYSQTPVTQTLTFKQLKDDLWEIDGTTTGANDAGNIAVLVTSEGVVLVDDRFTQDYPEVVAAVKKITPLPIKYVINTHHHRDHTGSNAQMMPNAQLLIQENARKHMVDTNLPGPPNLTFSKEASIFLGGKEVRGIYYGRGHTDGDIAVYIPHDKAIHLGDLFAGTNGVSNPTMDYANGASLKAWPSTLDGALGLDIDLVIPGHGAVTNRAGLKAHRDKIAAILKRSTELIRGKKSKDEVTKAMVAEFDFKPINVNSIDGMMTELKN